MKPVKDAGQIQVILRRSTILFAGSSRGLNLKNSGLQLRRGIEINPWTHWPWNQTPIRLHRRCDTRRLDRDSWENVQALFVNEQQSRRDLHMHFQKLTNEVQALNQKQSEHVHNLLLDTKPTAQSWLHTPTDR